jgi:hypothetical protein
MYRFPLVLAAIGAMLFCAAGYALAQAGSEYQLPPVKLKPERPITTQPIPPTPAPAELEPEAVTPAPVPTVAPAAPVAVPAPETPAPAPEEPVAVPTEAAPPAPAAEPKETLPPVEPPSEILWEAPEPAAPVEAPPAAPVEAPIAKPAKAPASPGRSPATPGQSPVAVETPPEPMALPPMPPELAGERVEEAPPMAKPQKMRKPAEIQKEAIEAQIAPAGEAEPAGQNEVALVEEVARTRKAYDRALTTLKDYYLARANATKLNWVNSELAAFEQVPKIQYLGVAELASPTLRPTRRIEAADQLYAEGIQYKDYPAFPPGKKDYLKTALQKFQTIVEKYPNSDKIDDAAFRMGEIYSGWYFQDYTRAVQCYERCWQWNPRTEHPALFNAAKIYDEKLKNRAKAVELYNRVLTESANENLKNQALSRLKALTGK